MRGTLQWEGSPVGADAVAFNADGSRLATVESAGVRIWEVATMEPIAGPFGGLVNRVAFSPDGTQLATVCNDRMVRRWDVATGEEMGPALASHADWPQAIAFSPTDAHLLVSVGFDDTARVWSLETGQAVVLTGHRHYAVDLAIAPNGAGFAIASNDTTARLWPMPDNWPDLACDAAGRNLAMAVRASSSGDEPYQQQCARFPSGEGAPADADVITVPGF